MKQAGLRSDGGVRHALPSWCAPRTAARGRAIASWTPIRRFPIEELNDALHLHQNKLPLIVLIGGLVGGTVGYLMQYYVTVIYYPINIAGRPLHSWPSYIIITFELTILLASISAVVGLLALCGLPMPYHPVFNVPRFALASNDRFFLCIESTDPLFDRDADQPSFWRRWSLKRCPKLRTRFQLGALVLVAGARSAACRQDMHDQPKYIPLRPSSFFADGRSARPIPENTVARGHLE